MKLWIRRQDKESLELTTYLQIIYLDELGQENKWVIEGGSYLGYYKTKERALEVLDEIQNLMAPKIRFSSIISTKKLEKYKSEFIPNPIIVYEMPEE